MIRELSVVIPVYNAAQWIEKTVEKTEQAIKNADIKKYEIIIVDDGSSDGTRQVVERLQHKDKHIKYFYHKNSGRFITRRVGIDNAKYDRILFVDARTWIDEGSLKFVSEQLAKHPERQVWNNHINVAKRGNIIARFGDVVTQLGWRRYFKKPRLTSYGVKDFDHYPKGTGLFFVPTKIIKDAVVWFTKNTTDVRNSSDDTLLIRHIAEKNDIWLSPEYSGTYFARTTLPAFIKHTYSRGKFFVDGFLRPGTRFYYPLIIFLIGSIAGLGVIGGMLLMEPWLTGVLAFGAILLLLIIAATLPFLGISIKDALSFCFLLPIFAISYSIGIWSSVMNRFRIVKILRQKRHFLAGSLLEYIAIGVVAFLFTCYVMDFIQFTGITHKIFARGPGDATSGFVWLNFADPGINPFLGKTDFSNYPVGESLGGLYFITYILLWAPVRVSSFLFGPIAGINIITTLGYFMSFMSMYWLMKRLTSNLIVSLFAGYSLAFFPYAIAKGTAHLAYIFSIIFVAILASFMYFWLHPSKKSLGILLAAIVASLYFDGYHLLLTPVMVMAMLIAGVMHTYLMCDERLKNIWLRIKYLGIFAVGFLILCLPILLVGTVFSRQINSSLSATRSPISQEIPFYRSWPIDFIIPARDNPFFNENSTYNSIQSFRNARSDTLSNTSFIGYVTIIFSAIGAVIGFVWIFVRKTRYRNLSILSNVDDKQRSVFLLLFLIAMVGGMMFISFMLSPSVSVAGMQVPLPGELFIKLDIGLWRNMSRFSEPLQVVLVAFSCYTLWIIFKYTALRTRKYGMLVWYVIGGALFIITFVTYANKVNYPELDTHKQGRAFSWLANQADIKTIAYLPIADPLDEISSNYSALQLVSGKRMVNIKNPDNRVNSDVLGSIENTESVSWAILRGADAIVVFYQEDGCRREAWGDTIMWDETWNVCVYRTNKNIVNRVDRYFAKIVKGVDATPNYDYRQKNTLRLNSSSVAIDIVNDDFVGIPRDKTKVRITANLLNWNYPTDNIDGTWMIYQAGQEISHGAISQGKASVEAEVEAGKPVELRLNRTNAGNDLLLQNLKVDKIN